MIDFTPNPIAFAAGPIDIRWYGVGYVVAIVAATWLAFRLARQRGERTDIIIDSLIVMAVAALIGGRAYHVIDQWALYKDDLLKIVMPPYSGLGIYGGLFTGLLAVIYLTRHYKLNFWRWGDIIAPCILVAQAVGRWGNFMNQELYGPPTNLPWGIAIQCQNRVAQYHCPGWDGTGAPTPVDAHFIPLFFYESVLSLIGIFVMIFLWRQFTAKGRLLIAGDVGLLYFVWYGIERSGLETLRGGWDWTFFGIPMAQLVGMGAAAAAIVAIVIRHAWVRRHKATPPVAAAVDGSPASAMLEGATEATEPTDTTTEPTEATAEPGEPTVEVAEPTTSEDAPAAVESAVQSAEATATTETVTAPDATETPAAKPVFGARLAKLFGRKGG
jgi:phosphatidylglycerol:prolipoprotein diacylglycerol transferase